MDINGLKTISKLSQYFDDIAVDSWKGLDFLSRTVPFMREHNFRLWPCKGSLIWSSMYKKSKGQELLRV